MRLKTLYEEITGNTFQMYHGGSRWLTSPEVRPSKNNRYEGGVGLYFTNSYERARTYAKGSKVVQLVNIDRNFKDLDDVRVDVNEIIEFLNSVRGLKKRKEIIQDLQRTALRSGSDVRLSVLNNLIVNWQAGSGDVGIELKDFFVSKGVDASIQDQSGEEFWLVVFNPKIIKGYSVVDPKKIEKFMLPSI